METTNNPTNIPSDIPTNEQIIDDITKDIRNNISINNENNTKIDEKAKPANSAENYVIPAEFENSDSEEPEDLPDDFIDEEKLKDLEDLLSEEEKLEKQKSALNCKIQGNSEFKLERYFDSIRFYTEGLKICPLKFNSDRAVLYANRGASKAKLGRKQSAVDDCTKAIELNNTYLKAYLRRAKLYEDLDKLDESLADYNKIIELDPGNKDALAAQIKLPPMINEKNEKLKEEMLGKLKDLGNVILKPFGLSTDNFKLTQDPNSGGYSVNFTQGTK